MKSLLATFALFLLTPRHVAGSEPDVKTMVPEGGRPSCLSLADFVTAKAPWTNITANSEQRNPLYLGASPRDMVFGHGRGERLSLRRALKRLGEEQAERLLKSLNAERAEFEVWPTQNDDGDQTWAFARWRAQSAHPWHWLDMGLIKDWPDPCDDPAHPVPILPTKYCPWVREDRDKIFKPFLQMASLYDKAIFGDTVWSTQDESRIVAAWMPESRMDEAEALLAQGRHYLAYHIPQPARFNGRPITFQVVAANTSGLEWPKEIRWQEASDIKDLPVPATSPEIDFPSDYEALYMREVKVLGGEAEAVFPISGRRERFIRKNSAQPDHQLNDMVVYLEERYRQTGLKTIRYAFTWKVKTNETWIDISESNLFAIIPGSLKGKANRPVLLADHIDTAFAEDTFETTGQRRSIAGADDNVSATASLLRAAEVLKGQRPLSDVFLTHLTGEEYPGDDLGIRVFLSDHLKGREGWSPTLMELMGDKEDLGGIILMDMIGFRCGGMRDFQINLGDGWEDELIGGMALAAAKKYAAGWNPVVRFRYDAKSYLYNTDGYIYDNHGYPVVLLNEDIWAGNPHYHQSSDVAANLDPGYASAIGKTAIATALYLANTLR